MEYSVESSRLEAEALADAVVDSKNLKIFTEKMAAIFMSVRRCAKYHEMGYAPKIVLNLLTKKLELIKNAETVGLLKRLQKPCEPHFNGNTFTTDETWVPEEELIQWSLASLRAPLVSIALQRYQTVFEQVMGMGFLQPSEHDREE